MNKTKTLADRFRELCVNWQPFRPRSLDDWRVGHAEGMAYENVRLLPLIEASSSLISRIEAIHKNAQVDIAIQELKQLEKVILEMERWSERNTTCN